jgi:hypothetical protein
VKLKERKLNRLNGYDYSQSGWYFITIDCLNMYHWFGKIVGTGQCHINTDAIGKNIVGTGHCPVRTMDANGKFIQRTGQWPVRTTNSNHYGKLSKIINGYKKYGYERDSK